MAGFDFTVSLGDLFAGVAFICTGIGFALTVRNNQQTIAQKIDMTDAQNERRFAEIDNKMRDFAAEMKKLGEVIIELTRQSGRMDTLDLRMLEQGKRVDSMAATLRDMLMQGRTERMSVS